MRRKGFTLIEVLGVLIILGILSLITVPMVTSYIDVSKEKVYEQSVKGIIDAAKYYVSSEDITSDHLQIQVKELKDKGYLDKVVTDPRNGNNMEEGYVVIDWINNKYEYSFGYVGESDSGKNDSILAINKLTIDGKSEQTMTNQGKNFLNLTKVKRWDDTNITTSNIGVNEITVSSETSPQWAYQIGEVTSFLEVGKTYTISGTPSVTENTGVYFDVYDGNNTRMEGSVSTTTVKEGYIYYIKFYVNQSNVALNTSRTVTYTNVQIEEGSKATSYEPFTPNSPSPDYPSEIKSMGDNGTTTIRVTGKNVLDLKKATLNVGASVTIDQYDSNRIVVSSTTGEPYTHARALIDGQLEVGKTYVISAVASDKENSSITVDEFDSNNNRTQASLQSFTVKEGYHYYIKFYANATGTNFNQSRSVTYSNIQIEEGNKATTYEPYQGYEVTYPVTLRSLPDGTHDELIIDNINGKATVIRRVGVVNNNSNQYWATRTEGNTTYEFTNGNFFSNPKADPNGILVNLYCNRFKIDRSSSDFEHARGSVSTSANSFVMYINKKNFDAYNLTSLQTWLSANPLTVLYPLNTIQEEVVTYTPIMPLEGSTHISIKGTASPNIHLDYIG